ncbi:hypothetical protein PoB_001191800 [Plakobranchus ocellatus]|uniref:Uncharacterized protein n=1 Tax=Plakobranchus ocellatus TaxID=259542 RepID=A0AAV3YS77_9GAST|nr:hypothetical protein PoB_001191800 [Plakobranchus ocellatus]
MDAKQATFARDFEVDWPWLKWVCRILKQSSKIKSVMYNILKCAGRMLSQLKILRKFPLCRLRDRPEVRPLLDHFEQVLLHLNDSLRFLLLRRTGRVSTLGST